MKMSIKIKTAAILMLLITCFLSLTWATTIEKMNLATLAKRSGRIIVAKCIEITTGTVTGGGGEIPCTIYTFAVSRSIKGIAGGTLEVRQFGTAAVPGRSGVGVPGMPRYKAGEEFVLLLTPESRISLCAPVGLAQGCFTVKKDEMTGARSVRNGFNNAGLFDGMDRNNPKFGSLTQVEQVLVSRKKGAIELDAFVSILEKLAN